MLFIVFISIFKFLFLEMKNKETSATSSIFKFGDKYKTA